MWLEIIFGLVIYRLFRRFFYDDDVLDIEGSDSSALFSVADRSLSFPYFSFPIMALIDFNFFSGLKNFTEQMCMWVFGFPMPILLLDRALIWFFSLNSILSFLPFILLM